MHLLPNIVVVVVQIMDLVYMEGRTLSLCGAFLILEVLVSSQSSVRLYSSCKEEKSI